jgi:hypothetical protein
MAIQPTVLKEAQMVNKYMKYSTSLAINEMKIK